MYSTAELEDHMRKDWFRAEHDFALSGRAGNLAAMLYAFFDESGIHAGAKILTVGGWIASQEEWESFACQWRTTLKRAGVSAFHFVDFNHSVKEFKGWTPRWKEDVLRALFSVIERRDLMGVSGAIVMDDLKSIIGGSSGTILHKTYGPYWVCLQYCVEVISKRVNDEVLYCLDRNQEFDSPLRNSFASLKEARADYAPKISGIIFKSKFDYCGTQKFHPRSHLTERLALIF